MQAVYSAEQKGCINIFNNKVAVVTGGAQGIGACICEEFSKHGANVCIMDIKPNSYFTGDIADEQTLRHFAEKVIKDYGKIDYLINNAKPIIKGLNDCTYDEFNNALKVGVTAPFLLTQLFNAHFSKDAAIVNICSSRDRMSQPNTESYTAAKGAISSLTHALAISLAGRVRVNSISPGWIDTGKWKLTEADRNQHPVGRIGTPEDIANIVLFLCSDKAGFITGENICVDGGMTHQMIYTGDFGWRFMK